MATTSQFCDKADSVLNTKSLQEADDTAKGEYDSPNIAPTLATNDLWSLSNHVDTTPCKVCCYLQVPKHSTRQPIIYSKLDFLPSNLLLTQGNRNSSPDSISSFVEFSTQNFNCREFIIMGQENRKYSTYSTKQHDCEKYDSNKRCISLETSQNFETKGTMSKSEKEDGLSCRICHSDQEPLVSPCGCTGSMKYVHEACLMNWLKSSVKTNCELCLHKLRVKKSLKPLNKWRRPVEKPVAIIWLLTFLIALTLNVISITKDASRQCKATACIIYYVLGSIGAILGVVFLVFWAMKCVAFMKKWLTFNQVWMLEEKYLDKKSRAPKTPV